MNLEHVKKIYFVGIGGIMMSATAGVAAALGYEVLGSDATTLYAPAKNVLDAYGISYTVGYDTAHIAKQRADLYIVSAGEDLQNPEVAYLEQEGLEYHSFSELLYELYKDKLRIVVAGTHGKSTTSGMLGHTLVQIDDSSFVIGGVLQQEDTNFHIGEGHYVVFEGDEYKALHNDHSPKFHYYKPDILVLTNLEYDHPDMYASLEDMEEEFRHLISNLPEDGLIVYNADDAVLAKLVHESNVANFSYSVGGTADFVASEIRHGADGVSFVVQDNRKGVQGKTEEYVTLLPGEINVRNALAGISLLVALGFDYEAIYDGISTFYGIKRRFELVSADRGVTIIDDYAHHPTAVRETLEAAKLRFRGRRIWAVFEPHTFSRTMATLPELVKSFEAADEVLIAEIYPARESVQEATIHGADVVAAVAQEHEHVRLVADKTATLDILAAEVQKGDVVVVMAVGSFNKLGYELAERMKHEHQV